MGCRNAQSVVKQIHLGRVGAWAAWAWVWAVVHCFGYVFVVRVDCHGCSNLAMTSLWLGVKNGSGKPLPYGLLFTAAKVNIIHARGARG